MERPDIKEEYLSLYHLKQAEKDYKEISKFIERVKEAIAKLPKKEKPKQFDLLRFAIENATPTEYKIREILLKTPGLTCLNIQNILNVSKERVNVVLKNKFLFYGVGTYRKKYYAHK